MIKKIMMIALYGTILTSCARQISPDVYTARQVGQVTVTRAGVIKEMRPVLIQSGESLENNGLGIVGGGVAGGAIGNAVGRRNLLPTALGAVAGAVAGSLIEKRAKQQTGMEYIIEFEDGSMGSLVQGQDATLVTGQPVYVISGGCDRSRIIAR